MEPIEKSKIIVEYLMCCNRGLKVVNNIVLPPNFSYDVATIIFSLTGLQSHYIEGIRGILRLKSDHLLEVVPLQLYRNK